MTSFDDAFATEWPRVVGAILRAFGSLDLAEESAQEAFARAAELTAGGTRIDNLGAWATTAARRIAIDSLRRDAALAAKLPLLVEDQQDDETDDRLGLVFIACDPVLSTEQQVALALRIVCGVPTADIAAFFGIQEPTIAARLTRAKRAIERSGHRFEWLEGDARISRLEAVLTTIYGVYTLGHTANTGDELTDARLGSIAHALAESVVGEFGRDTEALGLLALIELGESRRPGRTSPDGIPLTLAEVDRSAWGRQRMSRGLVLAARALPGGGRFALQAGISGLHSSAARWEDTDWNAINTLYYGLLRVWPAPVVKLGALVARSHLGPLELDRATAELRALPRDRRVSAALADLEERRGDIPAALAAAREALDGESNGALVRFYERMLTRLTARQRNTA
ncbi:MAG: putative polymerase, sigma-24 subunit, subfamily [Microbacteriaceae bacterium]|nr:putative polymerase, sigma-24 subunit, subfamily [Microbacteriaceae bacterium]